MTSYSMGGRRPANGMSRRMNYASIAPRTMRVYQLWLSGKKVELRRVGSSVPLEEILQKQTVVDDRRAGMRRWLA